MLGRITLCLTSLCAVASVASAAPIQLGHQGRLLDNSGEPFDGTLPITIRLMTQPEDGIQRFIHPFASVQVDGGYYSVVLGSDAYPLDSSVFTNGEDLWVDVIVDEVPQMPRAQLLSVPRAAAAMDVAGGTVTASSVQITGSGGLTLGQSTDTACTTPGALIYDPVDEQVEVCIAGTYEALRGAPETLTIVQGVDGRTWSDGSVAVDCNSYRNPSASLYEYRGDIGDGEYLIDPDGDGGTDPWTAICDMSTDGGGWTIVHSVTGADGEQPLISNTAATGDPLAYAAFNLTRAQKMALAAVSSETLFLRNNGTWLRANACLFDGSLDVASRHVDQSVTLTANNGATATATMGYSNFRYSGGGDFGVVNGSFDHHSTTYYHLNSSCVNSYLYSYSNGSGDSDAGYDVSRSLGTWAATASCDSAEGGSLRFRTAVR